jgi:hypothetical protein
MDAGVIGVGIMIVIGSSVYIYDRCIYIPNDERIQITNQLLIKKKSFRVKDLFNHVQI